MLNTTPQAADLLESPIAAALATSHAALACRQGLASKYPTDVAPFAVLHQATAAACDDLHSLLRPGEAVFLGAPPPHSLSLASGPAVPCLQMQFPEDVSIPSPQAFAPPPRIVPLTCKEAPAMLDLIAVAYPGYFRAQTCRMGRYFGVWDTETRPGSAAPLPRLLGMVGERLIATPWREISALCVHPELAPAGLGTALLLHMLALHRSEGSRSWLWVVDSNERAIRLYRHLGFVDTRQQLLHRLTRPE